MVPVPRRRASRPPAFDPDPGALPAMSAAARPRVIVTRRLPAPVETRMKELFETRLNAEDRPLTRAELAAAMGEADVLVPTVTDEIDAALIAQAGPRLALIASFGTGGDHVDLEAARQAGLIVTNTPGVLTEDTADVGLALILAVARRLNEGERLVRAGIWAGWAPTLLLGHRLAGRRLGIVGLGRIGRAVARRARAFGLGIHYHNRRRVHPDTEAELEATYWESLDEMLARMDIVLIACPLTAETHHLLDARRIGLLDESALVINISRGEVVAEAALAEALLAGRIAGVGLDVYEREPAIAARLLESDKAVLLPHIGSATEEGRMAMGEKVIVNIKSWADGHRPPDRVVPEIL